MSVSSQLSSEQTRIWRTYWTANTVLAVVNGIYGAYAFLYLARRLSSAGGPPESILDNLLLVISGSMIFEFFAEPITGDWADSYGRRRMVTSTYLVLCIAFLSYWFISSDAVSSLGTSAEVRTIVIVSLLAEVFYAVASALFNGALDAWFVDELRIAGGPQGADLLRFFSRQRRWSGLVMVAAGALSLWIADVTAQPGASASEGLLSVGALPWLVAAVITAAAAVWLTISMVEHRPPVRGEGPSHKRIWRRLQRTLRVTELRNALLISSVLYTCWICFMYLLPVLLTEKRIAAEAGVLQSVVENYYWYYLAMGTSRFLGPYLSGRLGMGLSPMVKFRWWGVLNCGALAVAGLALLSRSQAAPDLNAVLVPVSLTLFWVAKVAEEAFKPVRSTYLNVLVVDGTDRAFVLSMATPFGAVIIVFGVGLLAVFQQLFAALNEVSMSVPLLFFMLGMLGVGLTVKLSRSSRVRE